MCLKFGFVVFWRKDFGAKAARKILVKLTHDSKPPPWYILSQVLPPPAFHCKIFVEGKNRNFYNLMFLSAEKLSV